jgi:hypothetical protein
VPDYLKETDSMFRNVIIKTLYDMPFNNIDGPLFHFTSESGLNGILNDKAIRASSVTSLDDKSEINYALGIAQQLVSSSLSHSISEHINALLDPTQSRMVRLLGLRIYTVSLRPNTDNAKHWNDYGDKGHGYAIAFNPRLLRIPGILCLPVLYDPALQYSCMSLLLDSMINLYYKLMYVCPSIHFRALNRRFVNFTALGIWTLTPLFKGQSYSNENEWRLIVFDPENVDVDYGVGITRQVYMLNTSKPYKLLEYDSLPLVGLEIGSQSITSPQDHNLKQRLNIASGNDVMMWKSTLKF